MPTYFTLTSPSTIKSPYLQTICSRLRRPQTRDSSRHAISVHIEVESTTTGDMKDKKEGLEMSEWQFQEMEKMSPLNWPVGGEEEIERDVFLVFRVSAVGYDDVQIEVLS
jgi:hypothetical protein